MQMRKEVKQNAQPAREWPYSNAVKVRCADCANFKRLAHPRLGNCLAGQPEAPAGLWDETVRFCNKFTITRNDNEAAQ